MTLSSISFASISCFDFLICSTYYCFDDINLKLRKTENCKFTDKVMFGKYGIEVIINMKVIQVLIIKK